MAVSVLQPDKLQALPAIPAEAKITDVGSGRMDGKRLVLAQAKYRRAVEI